MDDKRELRTFKKVVATAGTRVQLSTTVKHVVKLSVKALSTNTNLIYIGDNTVSNLVGYQLSAKEVMELSGVFAKDNFIFDLSEIYIDSAVNGEGVTVSYFE